MQNFKDLMQSFEARKQSFITAFWICMNEPLRLFSKKNKSEENFTWSLTIGQREIRVVCD